MGIGPTSGAWDARDKIPKTIALAALNKSGNGLEWKIDGK